MSEIEEGEITEPGWRWIEIDGEWRVREFVEKGDEIVINLRNEDGNFKGFENHRISEIISKPEANNNVRNK